MREVIVQLAIFICLLERLLLSREGFLEDKSNHNTRAECVVGGLEGKAAASMVHSEEMQ